MSRDFVTLACDVGGTNTSLAAIVRKEGTFSIIHHARFTSNELPNLRTAIAGVLSELDDRSLVPGSISISGAGPVEKSYCSLSNVKWDIDGAEIERETRIPTFVINDFSAISYGIPLMNTGDPNQLLAIPHPDGTIPPPDGSVRAIVGAGTGLGVGYLVEQNQSFTAFPSEGGHSDFAVVDEVGRDMWHYLRERIGKNPGAELFVSGQGLANTLAFFQDSQRIPSGPVRNLDPSSPDVPRLISELAEKEEPTAQTIMRTFIVHYARFASTAALHFLPTAGLFLAGGIATKNIRWFTDGALFMEHFLRNYRSNVESLLARIPVYIVRDYNISLYGAAHAAYLFQEKKQ